MKTCPVRVEFLQADRRMDGRTERHDETNNRFSQFCERAKKPPFPSSQELYVGSVRVWAKFLDYVQL